MDDKITQSIRKSYDQLSDEYARRLFNELQNKPLDRQLLGRFAVETAGRGKVCDLGCGPGQVARYLHGCIWIGYFSGDAGVGSTTQP
jgi:hypothetical protein